MSITTPKIPETADKFLNQNQIEVTRDLQTSFSNIPQGIPLKAKPDVLNHTNEHEMINIAILSNN